MRTLDPSQRITTSTLLVLVAASSFPAARGQGSGEDVFHDAAWLTSPREPHPLEQAGWIWVQRPGEPAPTPTTAGVGLIHLAAELELDDPLPVEATLWIAADNRAEVTINGARVGGSEDWSSPSTLDVTGALRPGRNQVQIVAENTAGVEGRNPAGVLVALAGVDSAGRSRALELPWTSTDGTVIRLGPSDTPPWGVRAPEGPCPIFRNEFEIDGEVAAARLAIVGLGHHELRLNGQRVGKTVIDQPWSQYDRTIYYGMHDVTGLLRPGFNALGVLLGNSFFRVATPPAGRWTKGDAMPDFSEGQTFLLRACLEVRYRDGRVQVARTGPGWKVTSGPLVFSHVYAGEDYDARLWPPGWDEPGFEEGAWQESPIARAPPGTLVRQNFPGLRECEVFPPTGVREPRPGVWSYRFAQNCSAVLRFRVRGPPGATFELKPSEVITEDGVVEQLNLHGRETLFRYTLRGGEPESHQWLFHYHGFQFVQVTGAVPAGSPDPEGLPVLESLELVHVRAGNPTTGRFQCSSDLLNRTHDLIDWAMRSNMSYVLTDCPHREKLGWLECSHLLARSFLDRYDCVPWLKKIMGDIEDAQRPSGRILTVAPAYLIRPEDDAYAWTVEWGAAGVLLPWQVYEWTGDATILERHLESMKRFVDHVETLSPGGIAPGSLGDWYDYGHGHPPGPSQYTPPDLSATACWAMTIHALEQTARILGRSSEEEHYRALGSRVRSAFLDRFYDRENKVFENHGSPQTAHSMALEAGLVPEGDRPQVLQAILDDLERRDWQQTPGDVGHLFFLRALAEAGRSDILHRVYARTSTGSYGGILGKGLTTLPESWDASTTGSNSLNHCMLGHAMEWLYGWVLGLRQAPGTVGWRDVVIGPEPGDLSWCRGEILTPRGPLSCAWERDETGLVLQVAVPAEVRATVVLPGGSSEPVTLDGTPVPAARGWLGRLQVAVPPGAHVVRAGTAP